MNFFLSLVKNKWFWIILGIIIVVIIIYKYGKSKAEGPQVEYPDGGSGIPAGWTPEPLINELHDTMNGIFDSNDAKESAWYKMYTLPTKDMFAAVYNGFNQKYFKEGDGTLADWIRNEVYYNYVGISYKELLLQKLSENGMP